MTDEVFNNNNSNRDCVLIIIIQTVTVLDTYCPQSPQVGHISGTTLNELSFQEVLLLLFIFEWLTWRE